MKHIIFDGGDRLGKSTLIKKVCDFYNYDNVTVRHFGKPPKKFPPDVTPFEFQKECFWKEAHVLEYLNMMDKDALYAYYENVLIWNRSHLGEFVYGQMFRKTDPKEINEFLKNFESAYLCDGDPVLILLTADPDFFLNQEDGNSFSQNIDQKTKEIELFETAFNNSMIFNKIKIKVNQGDSYRSKDEIFEEIKEHL
jgi:hypothetical protein